MAWALESTPCLRARLLAIRDAEGQHRRLVRYFQQRGFSTVHEVEAAVWDLPLRMVWGGAGALMTADCAEVQQRAEQRWWLSRRCVIAAANQWPTAHLRKPRSVAMAPSSANSCGVPITRYWDMGQGWSEVLAECDALTIHTA
jgi:hypothetical protein